MITVADAIEIAELKRDWECWELLAEQYPKKIEYKKHADALQLMILDLEDR
ncbi:MAG: hypothetical protein ACW98X_25975 [Promethearchaeota archaeon]|jgi:bacterioferritin (cytochrome b1)